MDSNKKVPEHVYCKKRILAPLVGGSDLSYRLLSRKYGAEVTFTEMNIASLYLKTLRKIESGARLGPGLVFTYEFDPTDRPLILQLAGSSAAPIIELANMKLFEGHIDGIDINCGCPQEFAMKASIGAAMLKNPDHLVSMCKEIVQKVPYPVSVKLRFEDSVDHTITIIRKLISVGVSAITVHGRFHWQRGHNRGHCDWKGIRAIKEAFPSFPIVLNGDVSHFDQFEKFRELYLVDGVMSGYGALRDPTLFSPSTFDLVDVVREYLQIALVHKNKWIDILRHIGWLTKSVLTSEERQQLFSVKSLPTLVSNLASCEKPIPLSLEDLTKLVVEHPGAVTFPFDPSRLTGKQLNRYLKNKAHREAVRLKKEEKRRLRLAQEALPVTSEKEVPLSSESLPRAEK